MFSFPELSTFGSTFGRLLIQDKGFCVLPCGRVRTHFVYVKPPTCIGGSANNMNLLKTLSAPKHCSQQRFHSHLQTVNGSSALGTNEIQFLICFPGNADFLGHLVDVVCGRCGRLCELRKTCNRRGCTCNNGSSPLRCGFYAVKTWITNTIESVIYDLKNKPAGESTNEEA